ncbi:hypothetical protein FJ942_26320 [Mesorhizobium sp. B2-4-2]|uniref:hypothetical protein n=1 Tax=Mesorhizobium sp. B2-4-2 TaxID=2589947 RepID=UPI00112BB008|nr:hypothetical protein [Mesorhizobium sp. B2-4-2]TPL48676.1 hypothetical protein FJ942_26320 [Mesorhizobium sp. B2-4-2]
MSASDYPINDRIAEARRTLENWASHVGRRVVQCGPNHLKVGDVNFYPTTGTFYVDGQPREPGKGVEELINFLEKKIGKRRNQAHTIDIEF